MPTIHETPRDAHTEYPNPQPFNLSGMSLFYGKGYVPDHTNCGGIYSWQLWILWWFKLRSVALNSQLHAVPFLVRNFALEKYIRSSTPHFVSPAKHSPAFSPSYIKLLYLIPSQNVYPSSNRRWDPCAIVRCWGCWQASPYLLEPEPLYSQCGLLQSDGRQHYFRLVVLLHLVWWDMTSRPL